MSEEMSSASAETGGMPEELRQLEQALGALTPARAALDRDRVMYEAGRAAARRAGRRRVRVWQGVCGILLGTCAGLAVLRGGGGKEGDRTAVKELPAPAEVAVIAGNKPETPGTPGGPGVGVREGRAAWAAWLMPGVAGTGARATMGGAAAALSEMGQTGGGSGGGYLPTLKRSEGLDALPSWQQQAVVFGGNRS